MNIFIQLQNKQLLSHNEQIIAKYILEHPHEVLNMNSSQLAKVCFVSTATIYRLCDKFNLSGFSELKVKISSSLQDYLKSDDDFDFDFPVKEYQTHYEIIGKIQENYNQTLISTAHLFDLDQIRYVVHALKKAKVIDIYTSAGNVFFAENFKFQMQEIGVHVNVPVEDYQQRLLAASSDSSHIAIIISFEGRGLFTGVLPQILQENKTPIILISSPTYQVKNMKPDYQLYLSPKENHYKKISSFSTRLSLLYVLDVIYASYFELDYKKNIEKKLKYYKQIARM